MTKPSNVLILKTALLDGFVELIRLPLWWYTAGLKLTGGNLLRSVPGSIRYFGVDVWSKNLFVPMYGDTSIMGRLISFIVRLAVLSGRSVAVLVWLAIAFALGFLYLIILPVAVIGFITHLIGVL